MVPRLPTLVFHSFRCPEIFAIKLIVPIKLEPNRAGHAWTLFNWVALFAPFAANQTRNRTWVSSTFIVEKPKSVCNCRINLVLKSLGEWISGVEVGVDILFTSGFVRWVKLFSNFDWDGNHEEIKNVAWFYQVRNCNLNSFHKVSSIIFQILVYFKFTDLNTFICDRETNVYVQIRLKSKFEQILHTRIDVNKFPADETFCIQQV